MALIDARKSFVQQCGRYDFVKDWEDENFSDAGGDFYLRAGQRWLDRQNLIPKSPAVFRKTLSAREWFLLIPDARAIQEVWMSNTLGNHRELRKRDFEEIRSCFPSDPATMAQGDSQLFALIDLRSVPEVVNLTTLSQFGTSIYSSSVNNWDYTGIIILPPSTVGSVIEVHGLFYQPTLRSDGDRNFWTEKEEFILVLSACRALEISYRNQAGVADWESAIKEELKGLEFDLVEEESFGIHQMEG